MNVVTTIDDEKLQLRRIQSVKVSDFFMFYTFIPVLGLMVFTCISAVFNIEGCHSERLCF